MKRPAFPASEADLADWSVYADHLQTQGDPRGELLALDLALPARPDTAALERYQRAYRKLFHGRDTLAITRVLGHVRAIELALGAHIKLSKGGMYSPESGTLTNLRDLLVDEADGVLDELTLVQPFEDHEVHWRRLLPAIPASCRRVVLVLRHLSEGHAHEIVERLPATVTELGLHAVHGGYGTPAAAQHLIADRFDAVEIAGLDLGTLELPRVFERTTRVRLQLRLATAPRRPRVEAGRPGEALFVHRTGVAYAVPHTGLIALERAHGPLGIRALLADNLAEAYALSFGHGIYHGGNDLVRRGTTWTLRGHDSAGTFVDGRRLEAGVLVKLAAGARVRFGSDEEWTFAPARR